MLFNPVALNIILKNIGFKPKQIDAGGGTHMYHYDEPRALTNRERARLHRFPDWYEFKGGKESVRKQIGMAFPPDGAKASNLIGKRTIKNY